jgi:cyclophilin family peptidyl-prolyl cis-trans isomerase
VSDKPAQSVAQLRANARAAQRRGPTAPPEEAETQIPRGRDAWLSLLLIGVLIAVALGAGLLIDRAIAPTAPAALAGCATSPQSGPHQFVRPQPVCITPGQKFQATVTTSQGSFVLLLHPEVAPVTVNNFVVLAAHGYYDNLAFWKSEDWVLQGGDPRGDGRGGPGYSLPDEPGTTPWGPGAVGMARVSGGAVNGSQFFIQKGPWPDTGPTATYNRFATVTSGMNVVQSLSTTDSISSITIKVS